MKYLDTGERVFPYKEFESFMDRVEAEAKKFGFEFQFNYDKLDPEARDGVFWNEFTVRALTD